MEKLVEAVENWSRLAIENANSVNDVEAERLIEQARIVKDNLLNEFLDSCRP